MVVRAVIVTTLTTVLTTLLATVAACGNGVKTVVEQPSAVRGPPGPIVVAEAWQKQDKRGTHLVFVGLDGRRKGDLTTFANLKTRVGSQWIAHRDRAPAWSPDGKWIVFQSTRGRSPRAGQIKTSLWLIEARTGRQPRRLTDVEGSDRDPVWTPDGKQIVFASNRGGSWDLWRGAVRSNRHGRMRLDSPVRITFDKTAELQPSVSPDGKQVVFRASDTKGRSRLRIVPMVGGATIPLTAGPDDNSPAWSPKGNLIAFSSPGKRQLKTGAIRNLDLQVVKPDGTNRRVLWADTVFAMETLPRWSRDGRYLFATSLLRGLANGKPILSSLLVIDLREQTINARVLHDIVLTDRFGTAIAPKVLNSTELLRNHTYRQGLRRVLDRQIWRTIDQNLRKTK